MDISRHGDAEENEEAKRIIEMEKAMEQEGVKCFVVMANRTDLAKFRGARVQAIREETLEQWMVAPVELVGSQLTEDWSDAPSNLTTDVSQIHTIYLNASKIYPKETLFYF